MTGWVILVDQPKDFPNADTPHKVITTSDYLARPRLFDAGRPKLVNLSRSYDYQSKGYYASLLAEARGHRVVPDRRDHAGIARGEALRARAAGTRGRTEQMRAQGGFPAGRRIQVSGLLRHRARRAVRHRSAGCCSTGSAVRRSRSPSSPASGCRSTGSARAPSPGWPTARARSSARRCTSTPSANGAIRRRARSRNTISPCFTTRTRRCRRRRRPRSSISRASPRSIPSMSSRSRAGSSPSLPNTTACSSARPPRSTITPTVSRAAPGRRACRSSTIRSR